MTVDEMIHKLEQIRQNHGGQIPVIGDGIGREVNIVSVTGGKIILGEERDYAAIILFEEKH